MDPSTRGVTSRLLLILAALGIVAGGMDCADHRSAARAAAPVAGKEHPVLTPAEALATFRLPAGFVIRAVAAEPDLVNPMSMAIDRQGRIFVSLSHTYRYGAKGTPVDPPANPVVRLELGADGRVARRTIVATGFANPVMGLAVRGNRLWATNLDRLLVAQLDEAGHAGPPRVLVRDENTPWNPFGMYRVRFGPDGLLYLTVGDHPIHLKGPTNEVAVRGNTGGLFRMRPDGSHIELVVQGMRAPFSFDIDPYGRLWVLSNGEGNPNRLIDAIWGADYHFQTRPVDWAWLAGRNPLAPPVWENPPGAHTAVVVYTSDAFPRQYWGNLFVSNWGAHGFPSAEHVILRHRVDRRGRLVATEPFLTTTDPRFRPTQISLAPDGNLYVLDWYGRDDESDRTGRLYKISYVGDSPRREGADQAHATVARDSGEENRLSSRRHTVRQRVRQELLDAGPVAAARLVRSVTSPDPLGAAEALWVARESGWPQARSVVEKGFFHKDWRVRRLAVRLLTEMHGDPATITRMVEDPDPAVALEAAIGLGTLPPTATAASRTRETSQDSRVLETARKGAKVTVHGEGDVPCGKRRGQAHFSDSRFGQERASVGRKMSQTPTSERLRAKQRAAVVRVLRHGAAADPRLRYRGALCLARIGDAPTFTELLHANDRRVRLAGLIALDEAFHERVAAGAARAVLVREIAMPRRSRPQGTDLKTTPATARGRDTARGGAVSRPSLQDLLAIGQRWPFAELSDPVIGQLKGDVSPCDFSAGLAILRSLGTEWTRDSLGDAVEHLLERVVAGDVPVASRKEKLCLLDVVAMDRPRAASRTILRRTMRDADAVVRLQAHHVLVAIGRGDAACVELCRDLASDASAAVALRVDAVASLAQIETRLREMAWRKLLAAESPELALASLRSLRHHADRPAMARLLASNQQALAARGPRFAGELEFLRKSGALIEGKAAAARPIGTVRMPVTVQAKRQLRKRLLANYRSGDLKLGRLAFRVEACGRCHLGSGWGVQLGPRLDGIADLHSVAYLVDSILFPSQVIKTGFMTETVITDMGKVLTGKVTRDGDDLVVTPAFGDTVRVPIDSVESRKRTNQSLMPELLETTMSEAELTDLIAYLNTLHARTRPAIGRESRRPAETSHATVRGEERQVARKDVVDG